MALDFPSNPTDGQVYDNFIYSSAKGTWKSLSSGASPNYLVNPTITNAVITATAPTSTTVPLTVNGAASQSANLQEWKNNAGTSVAYVSSTGIISGSSATFSGSVSGTQIIGTTPNDSGSTGGISIKAPAGGSQTSAYLQFVNNAYNAQWAAIEATSSSILNLNASYVRSPNNPAFRAYYPSAGNGAIVSFSGNDSGFSGRNGGWNGSSRFTAPVAGIYNFSFAFLVNDAVYYARTLFRINGTQNTTYGDTLASTYGAYNVSSMSMTFKLNANDYVELYNEGAPIYGSSYGSFSGFLVG